MDEGLQPSDGGADGRGGYGAALAAGNRAGALIGVRLAVRRGPTWVRRVVTITVIAFAIRLWVWG